MFTSAHTVVVVCSALIRRAVRGVNIRFVPSPNNLNTNIYRVACPRYCAANPYPCPSSAWAKVYPELDFPMLNALRIANRSKLGRCVSKSQGCDLAAGADKAEVRAQRQCSIFNVQ